MKDILYKIEKLLDCDKCFCCDAGLVYVLPFECREFKVKGIKLKKFMGTYFIPSKNGICVYYNHSMKKCKIYPDRPICCRLFPFDIFYSSQMEFYWVVYKKCNNIKTFLSEPQTNRAIKHLLWEFEISQDQEFFEEIYQKELACHFLERGDNISDQYEFISKIVRASQYKNSVSYQYLSLRITSLSIGGKNLLFPRESQSSF